MGDERGGEKQDNLLLPPLFIYTNQLGELSGAILTGRHSDKNETSQFTIQRYTNSLRYTSFSDRKITENH